MRTRTPSSGERDLPAGDRRRELGRLGEDVACRYLADRGFTIEERNWRTRNGEIDVIATKGKLTVFVEVKARRTLAFGEPEESVDARKIRKLRGLASEYLSEHGATGELRFDVISVVVDKDGAASEVRHIPGAF